ncbi:hypothetical protein SPOG_03613 [Schizosaccharomyces cryophilus OY26]|uniref:Ubiquitin 3 binding protein But2 C-terminal domain-containing protein n=1 Tax=Schizosaccharomyces cryophilus (strain OY26 / ATCC MYA-4695 / CBS 11777 / NBRC 106824 / NRRL Y48691) TaxID=653667 RepID=S9X7I8_SCHCR|nr:uncharacterized protein SPOG_03613 [Schizosaccharomyces cryophilus OY26]EPY53062.1 hypothetical protein SPOG_03613 [Schizosaccharomyces cryophilus OY26]
MKLFSSVSLSYALFSILACSPISSLAAPLTERSDIKQNEEFSVMSLRSGDINVHFHSFYVGDNNNVYLDPYDNGNQAAKFTLADTYLLHEGFSAHLGDNGALYFQRNDEGSVPGFTFGERIASGYALVLNGQSPIACPIEEDSSVYSVFFGKGNGNSNIISYCLSQKQDDHVNSIFSFDSPRIDENDCHLHFHIDKKVDGPIGIKEFKLYGLTSVADILTTWANYPAHKTEIGRFNCSSNGLYLTV